MTVSATEFIDNTTADNSIPELWSKQMIVQRESVLPFKERVDVSFKETMQFGDTIHVGSLTNLTVRTKTVNTAITFETQAESNIDILVNVNEYAAIGIENITDLQGMIDLVSKYAPKMAYALDLAVDDVLAGLVDDFGANVVGSLATALSYADLLRADQYLNDANVPDDDRAIVISPAEKANLMQMEQFINKDYITVATPSVIGKNRGLIGNWLTYPVYVSVNVEGDNATGHDNVMFHRAAVALVMQQAPKTFTQYDIHYLARLVAVEQVYGTKEMRDDHGVWMKGM